MTLNDADPVTSLALTSHGSKPWASNRADSIGRCESWSGGIRMPRYAPNKMPEPAVVSPPPRDSVDPPSTGTCAARPEWPTVDAPGIDGHDLVHVTPGSSSPSIATTEAGRSRGSRQFRCRQPCRPPDLRLRNG